MNPFNQAGPPPEFIKTNHALTVEYLNGSFNVYADFEPDSFIDGDDGVMFKNGNNVVHIFKHAMRAFETSYDLEENPDFKKFKEGERL